MIKITKAINNIKKTISKYQRKTRLLSESHVNKRFNQSISSWDYENIIFKKKINVKALFVKYIVYDIMQLTILRRIEID
jgi:hypothetical protein